MPAGSTLWQRRVDGSLDRVEVVGNVEQLTQIGHGFVPDLGEVLAAMAHFHHGHTGATPVQHFVSGLLQHRFG